MLAFLIVSEGPASGQLPRLCLGDCDDDQRVSIVELVAGVNALLDDTLEPCAALDANGDLLVTIDELLAAVDNGLNGCPAAIPTTGAAVTGFVMGPEPITVVADPADSPPGSEPVEGAIVRLADAAGETVAEVMSDADGGFRGEGLPFGRLRLEIHLEPEAAEPELRTFITSYPGAEIRINEVFPVSREQATELILARAPETALVVATLNPLQPGTLVFPAFGDEFGVANPFHARRVGEDPEWFFMLDPDTEALFAHPMQYGFVNARTGAITEMSRRFWWPAINGVLFWTPNWLIAYPDAEGTAQLYAEVAATGTVPQPLDVFLSPELVQVPRPSSDGGAVLGNDSWDAPSESAGKGVAAGSGNPDFFGFLVIGSPEAWLLRSGEVMSDWLARQGVRDGEFNSPLLQALRADEYVAEVRRKFFALDERIRRRRDEGGQPTLFIVIIAHGTRNAQLMMFADFINAAFEYTVIGREAFNYPVDVVVPAHQSAACKVRIILANCFAQTHLNRYVDRFSTPGTSDVDLEIFTASGLDEASGVSVTKKVKTFFSNLSARFFEGLGKVVRVNFGELAEVDDPETQRILDAEIGIYFTHDWAATMSTMPDGTVVGDIGFNTLPINARNSRRRFTRPGSRCEPSPTPSPVRTLASPTAVPVTPSAVPTLRPCGLEGQSPPACGGSCPDPADLCLADPGGDCSCQPPAQGCRDQSEGAGALVCGGACNAPGDTCTLTPQSDDCVCAPTACSQPGGPECGCRQVITAGRRLCAGTCPITGEECRALGYRQSCQCQPVATFQPCSCLAVSNRCSSSNSGCKHNDEVCTIPGGDPRFDPCDAGGCGCVVMP